MPLPVRISPLRDGDDSRAATHVRSFYRRRSDRHFASGLPLEVFSICVAVCFVVSPIRIRHRHRESGRIQETRTRRCRRVRYPIMHIFPKVVQNDFSFVQESRFIQCNKNEISEKLAISRISWKRQLKAKEKKKDYLDLIRILRIRILGKISAQNNNWEVTWIIPRHNCIS